MNRSGRTVTFVITAAVTALASAGCTGASQPTVSLPPTAGSTAGSATSTSSGSRPPTTTAGTPSIEDSKRQVLGAYLGMQHAFEKAAGIPDPAYPDLARYASGRALGLLTAGLTSMREDGLRARGAATFNPHVVELAPSRNPTRARVEDCMDTRRTRTEKIDGSPYQDTPGGRSLAVATVERVGGTWKVTGLGIHDVGSCTG